MAVQPVASTDPRVTHAVLWRRLDGPGHEFARVVSLDDGWQITGTAVFAAHGRPCEMHYTVACDAGWRTRAVGVQGWMGHRSVRVELSAGRDGAWRMNGQPVPAVAGCVDVDLSFTPATNLIPVRRLGLAVGQQADVRAAWFRVPELTLTPLRQVYRRNDPVTYHYESRAGDGGDVFAADLRVTRDGLVVRYPGLFEGVAFETFQND